MSGRTALLTIAAAAFLSAPAAMAQQASGDFRMLFTGDVMMSRLVKIEMEQRRTSPWTSFSDLFHSVSFVGGNFEAALGDAAKCAPEQQALLCRARFRGRNNAAGRIQPCERGEQPLRRSWAGGPN